MMRMTDMTLQEPRQGKGISMVNEEECGRITEDSTLSEPGIRLQRTLRLLQGWQRENWSER